jgi:hypothetical protein
MWQMGDVKKIALEALLQIPGIREDWTALLDLSVEPDSGSSGNGHSEDYTDISQKSI